MTKKNKELKKHLFQICQLNYLDIRLDEKSKKIKLILLYFQQKKYLLFGHFFLSLNK